MYSILKNILFLFSPERAHSIAMQALRVCLSIPFAHHLFRYKAHRPIDFCGIRFPNHLGIAAGFDKNAAYIDELIAIGFGYVEIGTVTPLPQEGNLRPRLFRLQRDEALMNRMGFNNIGVDAVVDNLKKYQGKGYIIGGNIGKNKITPNENAISDYLICFQKMYDYVSYFVVNVSSPNTPNLRELQDKGFLLELFHILHQERNRHTLHKPIFLKIAPDLNHAQLDDILEVSHRAQIDALIVSNTTIDYEVLHQNKSFAYQQKMGGISGKPIRSKTNEVISYLKSQNPKIKIIGVGGIDDRQSAEEKLHLGCDLIQIYTGFIYKGIGLVRDILE